METKHISVEIVPENVGGRRARISVSLRRLSRESRKELLKSDVYRTLRLGAISREQYAGMLQAQYELRKSLEDLFESMDGHCSVVNQVTGEEIAFNLTKYLTPERSKSDLLFKDIVDLTGKEPKRESESQVTTQLINYISRVKNIYGVALLGVLYMLEETITYAGPQIAAALDRNLELNGKGTRYLRGAPRQKADLWNFRKSLDLIADLQTQVNVVTASTITYGMYKYVLNPQWFMDRLAFSGGKPNLVLVGETSDSRLTH